MNAEALQSIDPALVPLGRDHHHLGRLELASLGQALDQLEPVHLGKTLSTPRLAYQAEHENHRRWLSLDLLAGRVDRGHPLYDHLLASSATQAELARFVEEPCLPDVLGLNYYVTSERFLDERLDRYPAETHGSNGQHAYADVEAVRVPQGIGGYFPRLLELWERYQRPVAITEAHLGGPIEEQLRWLYEAFCAAEAARARGADVRAVTAWALLGSFDWDSLVVHQRGRYEPGVFDVGGQEPRPTALAGLVAALARGERVDGAALSRPGWWRSDERVLYPSSDGAPPPCFSASTRALKV
jgi:dTDP-4-dehydrorhamnose reductase